MRFLQPRKITTMIPSNPNNLPPLEWAFQHMAVIGWPTLIIFAWKVSKYFERVTSTATRTVEQIDKMATNCFPTMQASLQNQDTLLHGMSTSLKEIAQNTGRRRTTDYPVDGNRA